jgi:hypothetical protein
VLGGQEPVMNRNGQKQMKGSRLILMTYLVGTIVLPIILLYPALVYYDLSGMGGYDGFASPEMMMKHGAWKPAESGDTLIYLVFAGASLLWLLSAANLPIAVGIIVRRYVCRKNSKK